MSHSWGSEIRWKVLVLVVILLVLDGCTRREARRPVEATHPTPAQPTGPQIGNSDSLIRANRRQLSPWVAMWRAALPGLELDSLWAGSRGPWLPGSATSGEVFLGNHESPEDVTSELLVLSSPRGDHLLYIDVYQMILAEGDGLEVGGEPDSRSVLVDRRKNTATVLRECGNVCGSDWGAWLSPTTFALAGWQDADDFSQWKQGTLAIYSISDSTVATYLTRVVKAEDFERYRASWEAQLLRRYHLLKPRR